MTSIDIKKKKAEQRTITTQVDGPALETPDESIDYSAMIDPLTEDEKPKKKGRGPSPHYMGLINAFREKTSAGGIEEYKVNLDKFRVAIGKKDLPVSSIRQGLRNNLHKHYDEDGRQLWETIQVSVDSRTGTLTLKKREPKPRKD